MAVNGNEIENPVGEDTHGANSYFEAFAGIVAALDALAKAVTPDADDDGTPPDEIPPPSCNSGAKCDALRVSEVIVNSDTKTIRGGLGSNVYPTVAEGAFAITNQIVSAVSEVSLGRAMVVPLRFEERNRYCEMVFTWKPDHTRSEERELIIRGYVSDKRQMAVCCCLHTKGDGIRAGFDMGGLGAANKAASQFTPQSSVHRL